MLENLYIPSLIAIILIIVGYLFFNKKESLSIPAETEHI